LVTEALLDSFPVSRYDTSLADVLNEIEEYAKLGPNWDSEGALPISAESTRLAAWLVQLVAHTARHRSISWRPPVVGPNADGGINLEWSREGRQVLMLIRPGQLLVEGIIEQSGCRPTRKMFTVWDAIDEALSAISSG
jgi:hypothetical protein